MPVSGGSTSDPVGVVLLRVANMDISQIGTHDVQFDQIRTIDTFSGGTLSALPAGLGLTGTIDGSHAFLEATGDLWLDYVFTTRFPANDATLQGNIAARLGGTALQQIPYPVIAGACASASERIFIASGDDFGFAFYVSAAATASPYNMNGIQGLVSVSIITSRA